MIYGQLPRELGVVSSGWIGDEWNGRRDRDRNLPDGVTTRERELAVQSLESLTERGERKPAPVDPDGVRSARRPLQLRQRGRLEAELLRDIRAANGLESKAPKIRVPEASVTLPTLTEARLAYRAQRQLESKELGTIGAEQIAQADAARAASIAAHRAANPVAGPMVLKPGYTWCPYRRQYMRDRQSPYRS